MKRVTMLLAARLILLAATMPAIRAIAQPTTLSGRLIPIETLAHPRSRAAADAAHLFGVHPATVSRLLRAATTSA